MKKILQEFWVAWVCHDLWLWVFYSFFFFFFKKKKYLCINNEGYFCYFGSYKMSIIQLSLRFNGKS